MTELPNKAEIYAKIKAAVEAVGGDMGTDAGKAMAFLLASAVVGPSTKRCAALLDLPASGLMASFGYLARKNGIWRGRLVCSAEWFGEGGDMILAADSLVLMGLLKKSDGVPAETGEDKRDTIREVGGT